MSSKTTCVFS